MGNFEGVTDGGFEGVEEGFVVGASLFVGKAEGKVKVGTPDGKGVGLKLGCLHSIVN